MAAIVNKRHGVCVAAILGSMAGTLREPEWVLLGQAGYPPAAVKAQLEQIRVSDAFDDQDRLREILEYLVEEAMSGHVPQPEAIAQRFGSTGETFARTNTRRVREKLELYYTQHPKRDEIHLVIPPKSYLVVAPRYFAGASDVDIPPSGCILEPADSAESYAHLTVRGRIDVLDPDLRPWLIVFATDGFYYLQCRVSRRSPSWQNEVRIGRLDLGETDGVEFVIFLVAADVDADFAFQGRMDRSDFGFGTRLPSDTQVLDSIRVVRRDIRPGVPQFGRIPPKEQS